MPSYCICLVVQVVRMTGVSVSQCASGSWFLFQLDVAPAQWLKPLVIFVVRDSYFSLFWEERSWFLIYGLQSMTHFLDNSISKKYILGFGHFYRFRTSDANCLFIALLLALATVFNKTYQRSIPMNLSPCILRLETI